MRASSLERFCRNQAVYLSVAAVVEAVLWAIGQQVNALTVVLYALCFGNLAAPPMAYARRYYAARPYPYNLLIPLALLLLLTPVIYVVSSVVVVWIAPPTPQSLAHLITTGWKLPLVVVFVYGVIALLYTQTKEALERRNAELQRSVELSAAQLEAQEQELERAREIQQSLLPENIPQLPGFEIAASWKPARVVGGDYYDVICLDDNRLAICIADVAGKGISAALLMASVQATVHAFARDAKSPAGLCSRVNSVLCGNIVAGKFVTFFYAVLDGAARTLQYCNAGHLSPILLSGDSVRQLGSGGAVLGIFPAWKYEESTVPLGPGDKLILFTDGITEAAAPDGQEFGDNNLAAIASSAAGHSASALNSMVIERVSKFCNGCFADDVTLLVVAADPCAG